MNKTNELKVWLNHQKFKKVKFMALAILNDESIKLTSFDYVEVLCYLTEARKGIYNETHDRFELSEAITDFVTAWNVLNFVKYPQLQWLEDKIKNCLIEILNCKMPIYK